MVNTYIGIPDIQYLSHLKDVSFQPIFIMGMHRSGTSILYKALAATGCFNYVQAYHIIEYDRILANFFEGGQETAIQKLTQTFEEADLTNRLIDQLVVSPLTPEEYGFILLNAETKGYVCTENLSLFTELCKKVQLVSAQDKPLLLKNPPCFPEYMYIKIKFPAAKFIFLHRDPVFVLSSQLKAWHDSFSKVNPYFALLSSKYHNAMTDSKKFLENVHSTPLYEVASNTLGKISLMIDYYLDHIGKLGESEYVSIRYEDLCESPASTLKTVMDFLELTPQKDPLETITIESRTSKLLPMVKRVRHRIKRQLKPYLDYCGYQ